MYRQGDRVGPWFLQQFKGAGGNGEVWVANRPENPQVALKILKSKKAGSEPYQRFHDEIELHRQLGNEPGVVPFVDACIPDNPTKDNPAWLAMEVAEPIQEVLVAEDTLESVVVAVRDIASTLSRLASQRIFHRDIKPANLFRFCGEWAISDFGLASFPAKAALTQPGRKLGPAHYIAPEMLHNPSTANAAPADVYSLAKSLWVLATGQHYPLPGQHDPSESMCALASYLQHDRAALLDLLLHHATFLDPQRRPSMSDLAAELQAWLSKPPPAGRPEESLDLAARIRPVVSRLQADRDARIRSGVAFKGFVKQVSDYFEPFLVFCRRELVGDAKSNGHVSSRQSDFVSEYFPPEPGCTRPIMQGCPTVEVNLRPGGPSGTASVHYNGMFDIQVFEGGSAKFTAAHAILRYCKTESGQVDRQHQITWSESREAPATSAQAAAAVNELLESWSHNFRAAVQRFVNLVEKCG